MDELEKILIELCQESTILPHGQLGCDFQELAEKSWARIVSHALVNAIDRGKIRHNHNRYYA